MKIYIPALYLALKRKDTPLIAKIIAGLTVFYALSPLDLVPDFIPVLGYLDDLIILPILAGLAIRLIPAEIMAECKDEAAHMWRVGKPEKWYYALPIVAVWLVVLWWIFGKLLRSIAPGHGIFP